MFSNNIGKISHFFLLFHDSNVNVIKEQSLITVL